MIAYTKLEECLQKERGLSKEYDEIMEFIAAEIAKGNTAIQSDSDLYAKITANLGERKQNSEALARYMQETE